MSTRARIVDVSSNPARSAGQWAATPLLRIGMVHGGSASPPRQRSRAASHSTTFGAATVDGAAGVLWAAGDDETLLSRSY